MIISSVKVTVRTRLGGCLDLDSLHSKYVLEGYCSNEHIICHVPHLSSFVVIHRDGTLTNVGSMSTNDAEVSIRTILEDLGMEVSDLEVEGCSVEVIGELELSDVLSRMEGAENREICVGELELRPALVCRRYGTPAIATIFDDGKFHVINTASFDDACDMASEIGAAIRNLTPRSAE